MCIRDRFNNERADDIKQMATDEQLKKKSIDWMIHADKYKYTYNYKWMGRPIIKYPNDMVMQQEIMWHVKPDLIIETGIAHGGSIIFSAAMLEMMGIDNGHVIGIDIDIRAHNKKEIENHPMYKRITMFEGSSIDSGIAKKVSDFAESKKAVMVFLDSNHTHEYVLKEMEIYSKLVTVGSYMVLPDTLIEFFPKGYYPKQNRPFDVGNSPMTAIREFLLQNDNFIIDKDICSKLIITEAIDGYLKRIK